MPSIYNARAAESTEEIDNVSISIAPRCFFTSEEGSDINASFSGEGINGESVTFNDNGIRNFSILCNNQAGYTVHAYATNLTGTNGGEISFVNYSSYTASGNDGKWTAQVTGGVANPVYGNSIDTAGVIYHKKTGSSVSGDSFYVTYKAYIGNSTIAGTYDGIAVYNLTMNVDDGDPIVGNYTLSYDANGGDETTVPQPQSTTGASTTAMATVAEGTPTHPYATFLGWSKTPDNSSQKLFKAGDKITITNANTTLYAIWRVQMTALTGNMQDVTTTACDAATAYIPSYSNDTTYSLTDTRDGKEYLVRKLADNQCWMVQNLTLEGNTDGTTKNVETWNWSSKTTGSYPLPASSTSGFSSDSTAYMYNGTHKNATVNNTSDNRGAYYSFLAATAGTGTGFSGEAVTSICPKGWRLPSKDMFVNLAKKYGGSGNNSDANIKYGSNFSNAYKAALVGAYSYGSLGNSGSFGYWWSSTIDSGARGYALVLDRSNGYPQNYGNKRSGCSVRCVFSGQ